MTLPAMINPGTDVAVQEYLIFRLGEEEYGIDILKVQEIRGCDRVTRIPNAPGFITGVTNLRGVIVPIIDLRVRFAFSHHAGGDNPVVIVLNLKDRVVGIVVDGVADVLSLSEDQIKPTPDVSASIASQYLLGIGVLEKRMLILMNIEKLLSSEEMAMMNALPEIAEA
ncbi:chemotaxis protein CheW [Cedecea sp.]|jgi:purine-binding chemotaxis protein CheW|uniref:chemotaxis protein CheW n=1 Tax=Cedecea sp. TaxID=1970739 RepID=UPI0012ADD5E2|nr:chemotaxis protein CheW [Enterobacteriaceae bacterium RIT693]